MNDLTKEALQGYNTANEPYPANPPFLYSSPCFIAWALGRWLSRTGRSAPRNVKMSRGFHIRANDMLMKWYENAHFERIN